MYKLIVFSVFLYATSNVDREKAIKKSLAALF